MRAMLITILVLLLCGATAVAGEGHQHETPKVDDPRFEFLEGLAGTWVGEKGLDGRPGGIFEFRVTAGGTAVEEREMVGSPMEMVTVYHMEDASLVGTHYCMLGNQPRVKAAEKVVDNTLTFACNGTPGNARSHDEEHVHGWSMRVAPDGKLHYRAELVKDGKVTEAPAVVLTRQAKTAGR